MPIRDHIPYSAGDADMVYQVRYEPVSRTQNIAPTVKADVHDALWMLTQQWRVGEFNGEDAASIIKAKLGTQTTYINRFKSRNGNVEPFDRNVPLEAKVERLPLMFDLGISLEIGFQWYKMLKKNGVGGTYQHFVAHYPVSVPTGGSDPALESNVNSMQIRGAVSNKIMNGEAFYNYIKVSGHYAHDTPGLTSTDMAGVDAAEIQLKAWLNNTYYQPQTGNDLSWSEKQLEYQFKMSLPLATGANAAQTVFTADRYTSGDADWYSVDVDTAANASLVNSSISNSTINGHPVIGGTEYMSYFPHNIEWKGMPKGRWWEFEDANMDLAKMMTQKQDISKLILMEFGFIYSKDWFVIPQELETGTVTDIINLTVTDVFGRQIPIQRAGSGSDDNWQRWAIYEVTKKGLDPMQNSYGKLLMMPTLINKVESDPIEKVLFLRDEVANMIWGVEDIVPDDFFGGMSGRDAASRLVDFLEEYFEVPPYAPTPQPTQAAYRYKLETRVPENWIPFIAARSNLADYRSYNVQRANLLRYLGDVYDPTPILPRTSILSYGLPDNPYYINKEEISKSGFVVSTSFQRTRWYDGRTFVWLGRKKQSGRGEANSRFVFDILEDKQPGT